MLREEQPDLSQNRVSDESFSPSILPILTGLDFLPSLLVESRAVMDRTGKTHISTLRFLGQRAALCAIVFLVAVCSAHAAESGQAKRVLMLFSGSQFAPGSVLVEKSVQQVLQQGSPTVEFYAEHLDASRFPEERHYRLFREYLQEKYAQNPPDVIVAFLITKFELAGRLPAELFPGIPVVLGALTEDEVPDEGFGNRVTGVVQRIDFQGALELILKLQPDTERIVVIGGTAPLDRRYLSRTRKPPARLPGVFGLTTGQIIP